MASPLPPVDQSAVEQSTGSDDPIPVAEGVSITPAGEVSVDEGLTETLLDLAETLEERTGRPVDVEHVVAAVVLANRAGKIGSDRRLRTGDDLLLMALAPQIEAVFTRYGGLVAELGEEDAAESAPEEHAPPDADPDEAAERT